MATTEAITHTGARVTARRFLWTAAAVAGALLAATGALAIAHGDNDTAPPPTFWSYITPVAAEVNPPTTMNGLAAASDGIVVAHVTGVRQGRDKKGYLDPTPPLPGVPLPQTSFVDLTVDRVVSGQLTTGQTLTLEMVAPPSPITLDDVRALIPTDQMLFFLTNNGTRLRHDGLGAVMDPVEDSIWSLTFQEGVISQGASGLYEALDPNGDNWPFLQTFAATTLSAAATNTEQATH